MKMANWTALRERPRNVDAGYGHWPTTVRRRATVGDDHHHERMSAEIDAITLPCGGVEVPEKLCLMSLFDADPERDGVGAPPLLTLLNTFIDTEFRPARTRCCHRARHQLPGRRAAPRQQG